MKIIARIPVIVFVLVVSVVGTSMGSPVPRNKRSRCQEFFYYDHGTDHCEHCSDICDAANLKGTMDQCWKQCQSYALNLWPPKQKNPTLKPSEEKHLTPSPIKLDDESDQSSDKTNFPLAKVIIPLLSVLAVAVVVPTLIFIKRKTNGMNNQGPPANNRSSPHHQTTDQTATVEQTAVFLPDRENGSALDSSARATLGTETSFSTVGIQEEGVAGSEERNQTGERGPTVAQATSSRQEHLPTRLTQPVMVSPEGNEASFAMALPHSPKRLHLLAASQRRVSLTELDLDSTELKTLLPSMSEDSLTGHGED